METRNGIGQRECGVSDERCAFRESALSWLAKETGATIAYSGSIPIEPVLSDTPPKTLSYVNGYAETNPEARNRYVNLDPSQSESSPFSYFMDGSRMAWKIAEFRHGGKIWPIVAGQIGVAYCRRSDRRMHSDGSSRIYKTILSIPQPICGFGVNESENRRILESCRNGINMRLGWRNNVQFDDILTYADKEGDKVNLAISRIQALMVATEKQMIYELADSGKLTDADYLIKDGSLEYRDDVLSDIKWRDIGGRLQYVLGVSKNFNADLFEVKQNSQKQSAASFISNLQVNQRTQAFLYEPQGRNTEPRFAVWYVRIRDQRLGASTFDGVLKVEMQLIGRERENGKDTLEISRLSEALIRERNPVCFGADSRWANHIYPVFVTERYLKSGFLPGLVFRSMTIGGGK
ncbi:MAG: hypothetical protein J6Z49_08655 [Kiritimatiellae bacterium]|nr:hypothetical protein [Kiritimatiellia bacterium]